MKKEENITREENTGRFDLGKIHDTEEKTQDKGRRKKKMSREEKTGKLENERGRKCDQEENMDTGRLTTEEGRKNVIKNKTRLRNDGRKKMSCEHCLKWTLAG